MDIFVVHNRFAYQKFEKFIDTLEIFFPQLQFDGASRRLDMNGVHI